MKIQEMKSGISHLSRKGEKAARNNVFEIRKIGDTFFEEGPTTIITDSELDRTQWSVVSFQQREAGGLTYKQAADIMAELDRHNIAGLCIVTDEAAVRIHR